MAVSKQFGAADGKHMLELFIWKIADQNTVITKVSIVYSIIGLD